MTRITGARLRDDTVLRLGGHGDNFHTTWASDGRQYVAVCDGSGWADPVEFANARLWAIRGGPRDATFAPVPGYPEKPHFDVHAGRAAGYWPFGTLAVGPAIYQFLATTNHGFYRADGTLWEGRRQNASKLIYSLDDGATWWNQDGTTPVVWETDAEKSAERLAFFEVDDGAFALVSLAQMGRGYSDNRDGYVYGYAPNGNGTDSMRQLVMFRVPTARVPDRTAYEFFVARDGAGGARWSSEIADRRPVQEFPAGWVNTSGGHPYAWQPSVVYVAALGLYIMANWGMGCAPDGSWFGRPSYLGLWSAPEPWGPWSQFHEEPAWTPGGDPEARCYQSQIPPAWIAADGSSFWLVWTDLQSRPLEGADAVDLETRPIDAETSARFIRAMRRSSPYYSFNVQRVDLTIER